MKHQKPYNQLSDEDKAEYVKDKYDSKDGTDVYATSRDRNLRELEIDFIIKSIGTLVNNSNGRMPDILDLGCGNGYTDIRLAQKVKASIVGIDFSESMIKSARELCKGTAHELSFEVGDVTNGLCIADSCADFVITERCLLNLPSYAAQCAMIKTIHKALRPHGKYVMVEGSRNGLVRLNILRESVGLKSIPDADDDNVSSLKFDEEELELFLYPYFQRLTKVHFGMYYLISRVVHPLLVTPDEPRFDAKINEVARKIAKVERDYRGIGHIVGYVLEKKP